MMFIIFACMICLSWFGARFIVAGSLTTGANVTSFLYLCHDDVIDDVVNDYGYDFNEYS